jgi:hypothetical protein
MNAIHPFSEDVLFPASVCNYLIDGLDQRLTSTFRPNYPDYCQPHDMLASHQRSRLPIILHAMQLAEEEIQTYTSIARNAFGGQAFHSNATAYPSQVEITLNRYSIEHVKGTDGYNSDATNKSSISLGWNNSCFGCGGPHPWMCNKVILCPHKTVTGSVRLLQRITRSC